MRLANARRAGAGCKVQHVWRADERQSRTKLNLFENDEGLGAGFTARTTMQRSTVTDRTAQAHIGGPRHGRVDGIANRERTNPRRELLVAGHQDIVRAR
jgi:hypothetical protein